MDIWVGRGQAREEDKLFILLQMSHGLLIPCMLIVVVFFCLKEELSLLESAMRVCVLLKTFFR